MYKSTKKAFLTTLIITMLLVDQAGADEQNICANLNLSGFNNSQIYTGFETSDLGSTFHTCAPGNSSSCSACDESRSYPKNIRNALCIPSSLTYSIDSSCSSLLDAGASEGCSTNNVACAAGFVTVKPTCEYRTSDNTNEVDWNWTVSYSNSLLTVSCSNSNYQGYTE